MALPVIIILVILSIIVLIVDDKRHDVPIGICASAIAAIILGGGLLLATGIITLSNVDACPQVEKEYQELLLYKETVEDSTNEELRFIFKKRVDEFNEQREKNIEGAKSFWWGFLYHPNPYEDTEYIEFKLNTGEKEEFRTELLN